MNRVKSETVLKRAKQICAERDLRLTEQRMSVLRLISESEKPVTAYDLLEKMRAVVKNPAPPTVYRALDFLLEHGLIHKIESLHAYVGCDHPDHPHTGQFLICSDCGEVNEVEDHDVSKTLNDAGKSIGFHTTRPIVELMGVCAECYQKRK